MTRKHLTLTVALLSGMGLATPAFAQTAEQQQAQLEAQEAREAAAEATEDALDAQAAAATADVVSDVAPTSAAAAISADVAALDALVEQARRGRGDWSAPSRLARWARVRKSENALAAHAFSGIDRLYRSENPAAVLLRGRMLGMAGGLPPLKRALWRRAAGL